MNLKTKTVYFFLGLSIFGFLLFGIWKNIELMKFRNKITVIEAELLVSEYQWIEYLKYYSPIYTNYLNNKDSLQETIGNKTSVLIYRYSKFMCESCIQEDLQEIEQFQTEIGREKILLLPAYPDSREGKIELANVLAKFNYVNIQRESFIIPSHPNDVLQRYFAVIDKDGNLTMVFFPRRGETNLTRIYFSEVRKFFEDNAD